MNAFFCVFDTSYSTSWKTIPHYWVICNILIFWPCRCHNVVSFEDKNFIWSSDNPALGKDEESNDDLKVVFVIGLEIINNELVDSQGKPVPGFILIIFDKIAYLNRIKRL